MREFKFRYWSGNFMYYDPKILYNEAIYYYSINDELNWTESDNGIYMQYTGLHDKNGKEIYEGDIIQNPDIGIPIEVKWETITCGEEKGVGYNLPPEWTSTKMEVIGNIYENPELLKGGAK